jgi:hypothetical protein
MVIQAKPIPAPFSQDRQLYAKLDVDPTSQELRRRSRKSKTDKPATLPGQPHILLDDPFLKEHLINQFCTTYLDNFAPHLWLVATQSHSHISSLTHQIVRGRSIVITEDPKLHLLWYHDRVFIKPIPPYLLSHAFWTYYLLSPTSPIPQPERDRILFAARGYIRTWAFLIQHKSDFALATGDPKLPLLPKIVSFGNFMRFTAEFKDSVSDADVAPRYRFGELRLSRINFWSQVLLKKFAYHKVNGQYSAYFSRYFGVILVLFAFFSTALNAMQVALAAVATGNVPAQGQFGTSWNTLLLVSGWFSVTVLLFVSSVIVFLALEFSFMLAREVIFAGKDLWRKRRKRAGA